MPELLSQPLMEMHLLDAMFLGVLNSSSPRSLRWSKSTFEISKHSYLQALGDIKTNTFVPTPATMHLAMGKISVIKAASSATNAKSMGLKPTNAQSCIASGIRKGSTEGITSSSTRSELTVLSLLGISERLTVLWMKYQKATEVLQRQSVKLVLR
jgi:hypothetical protein